MPSPAKKAVEADTLLEASVPTPLKFPAPGCFMASEALPLACPSPEAEQHTMMSLRYNHQAS
jgi:hypothetical protein